MGRGAITGTTTQDGPRHRIPFWISSFVTDHGGLEHLDHRRAGNVRWLHTKFSWQF
ncbi:MAG: hypothetical protein JWR80_7641 [Bradyrhizobium sp.]|nr:hypothetical protein [Bradyrhizobium sp.]